MKQLQQVLWSKGTFLTPQHLQTHDRYLESLLQVQLDSCVFHLWGFTKLLIDEEKLLEGTFCLLKAKGIFPDGLLFDIPEAETGPSSRMIGELFGQERSQLAVYLAVPEHLDSGINVGMREDTRTRFVAEVRMVRDENSGISDKPVQMARKNFRLLVEGESHEGSVVMQIARVDRTAAGTYKLSPEFVPAMIDVHGNDVLASMTRGLVEILGGRSSLLAAARRQKNQSLAEFTASDVANFWLLYTVNHHLPLFRHLFHRRNVHPEQLFRAMLSLAGALTTFSNSLAPRDLPEYNHERLGNCFMELMQQIKLLLETVIPANFVALALKLVRPSIYATAIEEDKYLKDSRLYLAVSADVSEAELISRAPRVMKVGAAAHVEQLIRQALPGLKMSHVPSPPSEIPMKLKYKYFSLDLTGTVWEGVRRARNLGVYSPSEFPNPQFELLILLPAKRDN